MEQNQTMHVARAVTDLSTAFFHRSTPNTGFVAVHSAIQTENNALIMPQDECRQRGLGLRVEVFIGPKFWI